EKRMPRHANARKRSRPVSEDEANEVVDYYNSELNFDREEITIADASALKRTVGSTAIGNFTEWFDFGVYSYLIVILRDQFFPASAGWATVATFAGLAVSFLLRPVGGIFWGILGDRIGRKTVLTFTLLMMACGSFALGLIPGYAVIGIWAPILLFILRGIQGFSTGGEYVHAMTFLVEHAPDRRRGYLASFLPLGTLTGYILGAVIVIVMRAILPHDAMYAWGWRVPFLPAGPLGLVGLYMRLRIEETPVYEQASEAERMSNKSGLQQLRETVIEQWRPILVVMGLVLSFNVTNYMLTGYMPTYLPEHLGIADTQALIVVVVVMVILVMLVNLLGKLTDHIGRKPVLLTGSILLIVISIPMFRLMFVGSTLA